MNALDALSIHVAIRSIRVSVCTGGHDNNNTSSPKCTRHWSIHLLPSSGLPFHVDLKANSNSSKNTTGALNWNKEAKIPLNSSAICEFSTTNAPQVTDIAALVSTRGIDCYQMSPGSCDCWFWVQCFIYHLCKAGYLEKDAHRALSSYTGSQNSTPSVPKKGTFDPSLPHHIDFREPGRQRSMLESELSPRYDVSHPDGMKKAHTPQFLQKGKEANNIQEGGATGYRD